MESIEDSKIEKNISDKQEEPSDFKGIKSSPDFKYEREGDSERLEAVKESLDQPKIATINYEGEYIKIEYIDIPAKNDAKRAIVILSGFEASYKPYSDTAKELALYNNDQRVICLSHLSGKSSSVKDYSLDKMSKINTNFFKEIGLGEYELTIVGHSRSDVVAMELGRTNPDQVKNIVLANGILANKENFGKLALDFTKHVVGKITPERLSGEKERKKRYIKQCIDFTRNLLLSDPKKTLNQFESLGHRKKVDLGEALSQLKSNVLVLSSTQEFTPYKDTQEQISEKLPKDINSQLRITVDGLHDEIIARPEAFALKLKRWLESFKERES